MKMTIKNVQNNSLNKNKMLKERRDNVLIDYIIVVQAK